MKLLLFAGYTLLAAVGAAAEKPYLLAFVAVMALLNIAYEVAE